MIHFFIINDSTMIGDILIPRGLTKTQRERHIRWKKQEMDTGIDRVWEQGLVLIKNKNGKWIVKPKSSTSNK